MVVAEPLGATPGYWADGVCSSPGGQYWVLRVVSSPGLGPLGAAFAEGLVGTA